MGVMAHPLRYALADLALALSRVTTNSETVRQTAARAAAEMIGDGAGVQLLREDGHYDAMTFYHPDPHQSRLLASALGWRGERPDDGYSTTLRATRRPVMLAPMTPDGLADLVEVSRRPTTDAATGTAADPAAVDAAPAVAGAGAGAGAGADQAAGAGLPDVQAAGAGLPDVQAAGAGLPDVHAVVLCPLIVDNAYVGYLVLVRMTHGSTYATTDVDLARDIAGELALALSSTRSLARLRASEERYRRVLESIPEGVLQLDTDGLATYANEPDRRGARGWAGSS